ncbi:MAG: TetR family transcriptional regulator [Thermodesulfobacteriota bacterium]
MDETNQESGPRMKIGRLVRESGVNRSTIHYYLNLGLLPKPIPAGLNVFFYDQSHLARLLQIKRLRREKKLSLPRIRELIETGGLPEEGRSSLLDSLSSSQVEASLEAETQSEHLAKKKMIVETATELFSQKGFEAVRIMDIAEALHMGKSTLYEYFDSKEHLFMECIERLSVLVVPRAGWDRIREERDYFRKQKLRLLFFLQAFPNYSGMLNLARLFALGSNPDLAAKSKEALALLTRPLRKDIERAQNEGILKKMDPELLAHFLLSWGEGIGWKLAVDRNYTIEQALAAADDLFEHGLLPRQTGRAGPADDRPRAWITDVRGVRTFVRRIRFDGRDHLPIRMGEAEVRIQPELMASLGLPEDARAGGVFLTLRDGRQAAADVPADLILSGESDLGPFTIPLNKVRLVSFETTPAD